jgi:hypothetical protein
MKNLLVVVLGALIVSTMFSSCQVEKRIHRPGYHVQWVRQNKPSGTKELNIVKNNKKSEQHSNASPDIVYPELSASVKSELFVLHSNTIQVIEYHSNLNDCDTIVLLTGERIIARIAEITPDFILYEDCLQPSESLLKIDRARMNSIYYRNGAKEQFEILEEPLPPAENIERELEPLGFISLILGVASFFWVPWLFAPLAVIAAGNSIVRIARKPDIYSGLVVSLIGLVLGLFMLIIVLLVIF